MPIVNKSAYRKPFYMINGHMETILPSLFRKVGGPQYSRERITTEDGDFLDIDWLLQKDSDHLAIISHGLEGSSERPYVRGVANTFYETGWNVLAWNCRSCSGEMNKTFRLYHHGATYDLSEVVRYAFKKKPFTKIVLIGFSMGGSLSLKYMGENPRVLPDEIKGAVVFSVPMRLEDSARALSSWDNAVYRKRFLKKLIRKIKIKASSFPNEYPLDGIDDVRDFAALDSKYSAPLNGFETAGDFYEYASAGNYLEYIDRPALIVNAKNDPMLPDSCYPYELAGKHPFIFLETPEKGGHVGFHLKGDKSWMEVRALEFVKENIMRNEK
ncbi:MAG TPA: alpha/beta hydrolase [Cytophagales bacterium]|jgi:predicted alpha/beta-fold hydrolase|nr:alpha/beta hydrolase [Cytophagales bacterium]